MIQEDFAMRSIKKMTLASVCVALCVVLPIAFHSIPDAGSVFLPMHIPVLICGMICGWPYEKIGSDRITKSQEARGFALEQSQLASC